MLKGAARRDLTVAYWSARFARVEKLSPLDHYLAKLGPQRRTTPDELVAGFQAFARAGLNVAIVEVANDEEAA